MTTAINLGGVITALVTPFKNSQIDKKSFAKLLRHQLDQGVQGFVINGTTGESPTLKFEEVRLLFDLAKSEVAGQVPLIVGTGSNSTAVTCEFSQAVSKWQPAAVLVVVPYYNKPPQRGLREHFSTVAKSAGVPVLLYNVPSRTIANLEPATIAELRGEKNIAGIKDATGDMIALEQLKKNKNFTLLSGDDVSAVDFCARGGHGVISVSSHLIGAEMREYLTSPTVTGAAEYKKKYAELMKYLYIESNPIPVKMALHWMGIIESPELRLPLVSLDEKFHKEFKTCLKNLGKIP